MLEAMTPNDLSLQVKVTLDALRAGGLKLGIGSSSRNARLILDRIGLGKYFDAVTDGTEISHSKPDPEVFLTTARKLTRAPAECLVVEDAPAGIEAACRAGMDSAAVGEVAARHPGRTYALGMFRDLLKVTGVEGGKS